MSESNGAKAAPLPGRLVSDTIEIDGDAEWLTIKLADHTFQCELYDALDLLVEIDLRHARDSHECLDCRHRWSTADQTQAAPAKPICPACQSEKVLMSQAFLDDVAKLLTERYGAPKCSRRGAAYFYNLVVSQSEEAKKKRGLMLESPTGTESTPAAGAAPESAPG